MPTTSPTSGKHSLREPNLIYSAELPNPRTQLGRQLSIIRAKIVASGERLLSLEAINAELAVDRRTRDSDIS